MLGEGDHQAMQTFSEAGALSRSVIGVSGVKTASVIGVFLVHGFFLDAQKFRAHLVGNADAAGGCHLLGVLLDQQPFPHFLAFAAAKGF
jgi:hypothetical protein